MRPTLARTTLWAALGSTPGLLVVAAATALARVPFLESPLSPDEAGFTLVARQWDPGPSLYGRYWVDRPPLLLELFRLASYVGTPVGLRLLGCLAAASATLFVGLTARRIAGPRSAFWTSAVAAIAFSNRALGAGPVNGELLAAPFVAGSIFCWCVASGRAGRSRVILGAVAGAAAASAVLIKQNLIDGVVFFVVATACTILYGSALYGSARKSVATLTAAWFAGAGAAVIGVMALARAHGSSVGGIWFAMYPFRWVAADPLNGPTTTQHVVALARLSGLEMTTLGPAALVALAILVGRRRGRLGTDLTIACVAVLAVAAYDVFSIFAGGSYWSHYLVQLVVPTALAVGIVAKLATRRGERVAVAVVAASLVSWTAAIVYSSPDPGEAIGRDIAKVSAPGDTILSAFGSANIVMASGLGSDYPYLWSLPAHTLDPNLRLMSRQLGGRDAPTWVVVSTAKSRRLLLTEAPRSALRKRYHIAARLYGCTIYLLDSAHRQPPVSAPAAQSPRW